MATRQTMRFADQLQRPSHLSCHAFALMHHTLTWIKYRAWRDESRNTRHSVSTFSRRARYGRRALVTRKGLGWLRLRTSSPDLSNSAMRLFNQSELFLI